jgi:hypothetical protein
MSRKTIFFAYESKHQDNKDAITKAADNYNKHQRTYKILRWETLSVSGTIIAAKIFEQIDTCDKFACDLTCLNHNVMFELGYAIAKGKALKIFLNPTVQEAKENYAGIQILKGIGYATFSKAHDISKEFQNHATSGASLSIENVIPGYKKLEIEHDVFLINIKNKNQAAIAIEEHLILNDYNFIANEEDEIAYRPLKWYLNTILTSRIVILHMVGPDKAEFKTTNAEHSLYAGIAYGLGKDVLLLAPEKYNAPIDYADILMEYSSHTDIVNKTEVRLCAFLKKINEQKEKEIVEEKTVFEQKKQELNLLRLAIGTGIAGKNDIDRGKTFVEIDAYEEALKRERIIIIGRKGAGKTEIFLRLADNFEKDKNNYNIILKPESDEMLGNASLSMRYRNGRSRKAFFSIAWQYVIISKIFEQIYDRMANLNIADVEKREISTYYLDNKEMFNNNFYGMILYISERNKNNNFIDEQHMLQTIKQQINPMIKLADKILSKLKYQKITILADNLDAGWDDSADLGLQSLMLCSLVEYVEILNEQYKNKVKVHSVIFLRKDIYNYIMSAARESDKIYMDIYEINWERFPAQLKKVLERRMLSMLDDNIVADTLWSKYFSLKKGDVPFDKILLYIVKRPRDAIYFFGRLFESAIYSDHISVTDKDFDYALDEYTKFLYNNLIAELKAEFPSIDGVVKELQRQYSDLLSKMMLIPQHNFFNIIKTKLPETDIERFIKVLMENNYLIAVIKNKKNITTYKEFLNARNEKILFLFHKNKILFNLRLIPFVQ